jgi:urea transport system permease protein
MFVETWQAIIGLLFVLVVLFLPRGLAGLANDVTDRLLSGGRTAGRNSKQEASAGE